MITSKRSSDNAFLSLRSLKTGGLLKGHFRLANAEPFRDIVSFGFILHSAYHA